MRGKAVSSAQRKRRVTHYGTANSKAACGNYVGERANVTKNKADVTCVRCEEQIDRLKAITA